MNEEHISPPNFRVDVPNPLQIYDYIRAAIGGRENNKSGILSSTQMEGRDGNFLSYQSTEIETFPSRLGYKPASKLYLTDSERDHQPYGYYSLDRIQELATILSSPGLIVNIDAAGRKTTIVVRNLKRRGSLPFFGKENYAVQVEVEMGYKSVLDYRTALREGVGHNINPQVTPSEGEEKSLSRLIGQVLTQGIGNKCLTVSLVPTPRADQNEDYNDCVKLTNEGAFSEHIKFYAKVYEKLIIALYREKGLEPPQKPITLSAPERGYLDYPV